MILKPNSICLHQGSILWPMRIQHHRAFSSSTAALANKLTLPTIAKCPEPTCTCAAMPVGLDIDHSLPLDGTMAAYRHHAIVRTGVSDWPSKIEDDSRFPLVQTMRQRFGRGGRFHDPLNHTLLSTSSHSSADSTILLFPSFKALSGPVLRSDIATKTDPYTLGAQVDDLITQHLFKPSTGQDRKMSEAPEVSAITCSSIEQLTILICGHGARDSRCGVMGPLLEEEFKTHSRRAKWRIDEPNMQDIDAEREGAIASEEKIASVELISHVGGHKFAGNVILYIPSSEGWKDHPLAGKGIWYGRVEPSHVDGILRQTVERGVIIQELFRGGISHGGELIRL